MEKIKYSNSITALRGISVIGVLLYHSKFENFLGGYLGVDIFFVISGYLISNLILSDLEQNKFKFSDFYIKRLRRLLPALLFTLLFAYILNYFILLPTDFINFKESIFYVLSFTGNYFFWKSSDYFSESIDILPLSHLWSLGVEEQFYLILPLSLVLINKFKILNKFKKIIITFGILLSLLYVSLDFYNLPFDCPSANCIEVTNFYWLHTRMWEFLIGVLINFFPKQEKYNKTLLYFGLLLIIISFSIYFPNNNHPGFGTLPVLLGSFLVIFSTKEKDENLLTRTKPLIFLGKISYSLYLIHFPLFVVKNYFDLSYYLFSFDILNALILTLSILIGYLMWKYIEQPFRDFNKISNKSFYSSLIVSIVFILFLASPIITTKEVNSAYKNFNFDTNFDINRKCFFEVIPEDLSLVENCINPLNNKTNIVIVGSSLSQNIYNGIILNEDPNININYIAVTGCPPFLNYEKLEYENFDTKKCSILYEQITKILSYRIENIDKILIIYNWEQLTVSDSIFSHNNIESLLTTISDNYSSEKVIVLGQPIVWKSRLNTLMLRELNLNNSIEKFSNRKLNNNIFQSEKIMLEKAENAHLKYFSIINLFCNTNKCQTFEKNKDKYYFFSPDANHITDYFSKKIGKKIIEYLN